MKLQSPSSSHFLWYLTSLLIFRLGILKIDPAELDTKFMNFRNSTMITVLDLSIRATNSALFNILHHQI